MFTPRYRAESQRIIQIKAEQSKLWESKHFGSKYKLDLGSTRSTRPTDDEEKQNNAVLDRVLFRAKQDKVFETNGRCWLGKLWLTNGNDSCIQQGDRSEQFRRFDRRQELRNVWT